MNRSFTLLSISLIVLSCQLFHSRTHQDAAWRGVYFSQAANLRLGGSLLIDTADVKRFNRLPEADQVRYKFSPSAQLNEYLILQNGYGYICWLARWLFFWLGDSTAVILLQVLVHILLSVWLLPYFQTGWPRWAFLLGYACNPVIIHFATFDFYYFWQALPAFLMVRLVLSSRSLPAWQQVIWSLGLALVLMSRPSTIGITIGLGVWLGWHRRWATLLLVVSVSLLSLSWLYRPMPRGPWHTVLVGVGAYQNSEITRLSDEAGYKLYQRRTSQPYTVNGLDLKAVREYDQIIRREVTRLIRIHPEWFLKNFVFNTLLGFSAGYVVDGGDSVNYALAGLGVCVLELLLIGRQFVLVGAVLASVLTFTPYFPPIPAYMYGAYLLLVSGTIQAIASLGINGAATGRLFNTVRYRLSSFFASLSQL